MLSRALSLATVTLLIGCFAARLAQAQNLEAGKSPAQIFSSACNACHKSPRGLLRTIPAGSLSGFLRQHYTTSGDMASLLSAFLVSNGAADTRFTGNQSKPGRDGRPEARPGGSPDQLDRFGRRLRPSAPFREEAARPEGEPQEAAKPAQTPGQADIERGPGGRKLSAKQRLSKRGKPGAEEPPKTEAAKDEAAGQEAARGEAAKEATPKGETAKIEPPKETSGGEAPILRPDPVPPVTPAPAAPPAVSAAANSGASEPAADSPVAAAQPAPPAAVTASVPLLPPVTPAGPPAPPISQ
jgi:hypothetical protein